MPARLAEQPVHVSVPTSNSFSALAADKDTAGDVDERVALALRLIDAVLEEDDRLVRMLVLEEKVDAWVQDQQGWTALHAAACEGCARLAVSPELTGRLETAHRHGQRRKRQTAAAQEQRCVGHAR